MNATLKRKIWMIGSLQILILSAAEASATPAQNSDPRKTVILENLAPAKEPETKVKEPADFIDFVPVLRDIKRMIPKQFQLANHKCKASLNQLVIEHRYDSMASKALPKHATFSVSYSAPVRDGISTNVDLPLAYKPDAGIKGDWNAYPLGNYTVTVNRGDDHATQVVYFKAEARF